MVRECHHIKPSGERCRAYALRGSNLCYFHDNLSRVEMARRTSTAIPFAPFEDLHGLQIAIRQVFNMIDNPYADTRRTGQMLYALQLATQVAARIANQQRTSHDCPKCSEALGLPPEAYDLETGSRLDLLPTETKSHPINETLEGIEQHLSKVRK